MSSSTSTKKVYSGPATRARLAGTLQYLANPCFMDFVKWKDSSSGSSVLLNHNKPEAKEDVDSLALMCLVGIVSGDMLQLDHFGSWSEKYGEKLTKAKLKFTLMRPTGHIDFEGDFDRAVATIVKLQNLISFRGSDRSWFYQSATSFRFRHDLFKERANLPTNDDDMDEQEKEAFEEAKLADIDMVKVSKSYPVDGGQKRDVEDILKTHYIIPFPAFDFHDDEIKPEDLTKILKGALVLVTFTLRYNFIGAGKDRLRDVNGFSAVVDQVSVLKNAPIDSPKRKKGPLIFPPAPMQDLRPDQVAAVKAFMIPNEPGATTSASGIRPASNEEEDTVNTPSRKRKADDNSTQQAKKNRK